MLRIVKILNFKSFKINLLGNILMYYIVPHSFSQNKNGEDFVIFIFLN